MPEAAVDEHGEPCSRKHDVGPHDATGDPKREILAKP